VDTGISKKIGKYEVVGELGRGGMGVVYRAEDTRIGRSVAIKTLNESLAGDTEAFKRFYREAQAPLHPNIAIVFDVGEEDGKPFIVMEYVDGQALDKLIASNRALSLVEKLSVIEQVCTGLGFAHQNGVIHRDIKPANIMVKRDTAKAKIEAKIVDFGIASVQREKFKTGLTHTGQVIGSVHYISPERLKGEPFDGRCDIWATGVMLYQLLTGQLPFPGSQGEEVAVMHRIIDQPYPPLSQWLLSYPPTLDAIVERALAKNPEERYATAEEFAADLHLVNEGLKKAQVEILFADAERLTTERQFTTARDLLRQLTSIDPQHTGARQLLGIVNQHLSAMQRAEEIRKLVSEADEAISAARFTDALSLLDQAIKRDPQNTDLQLRLGAAREKKRKHEEISTLMTRADFLRERGDWTGALNIVERALELDPEDTAVRSNYLELSKQVKLAAQQGQLRDLLAGARQEISSRQFTAALEKLKKAADIDPAFPELNSLLQTAMTGQEQERRRRILDQIQAEIEACLNAENFDRASELADRAVEQSPSEPTLLQLKTRVAVLTRKAKVRKLVDSTLARAQEIYLQAPGEALLVVQRALQELPGEERLLALEDSLRQRLKSAEKEEIRGKYLREAQAAVDSGEFEKAIEILESYQVEFGDAAGVGELLQMARAELAQQLRGARIAECVETVKRLVEAEQFEQAVALLEAQIAETHDALLSRLLVETREQQSAAQRRSEAFLQRIARMRERGQLDEAIRLMNEQPAAAIPGSPIHLLLEESLAEKRRGADTEAALSAVADALKKDDFSAAMEAVKAVQRAWGDAPPLSKALAEIESCRQQRANDAVGRSVEAARKAILAGDSAAARDELRACANLVEFSSTTQQSAWQRLKAEASRPAPRKSAQKGQTSFRVDEPRGKMPLLLSICGVLVLGLAGWGYWWYHLRAQTGTPAQQAPAPAASGIPAQSPSPAAPPSGTLIVQSNTENANVFVDGALKGFTETDGSLKLLLDPGHHSVRLTKAGYAPAQPIPFDVSEAEQKTVRINLTASAGAPAPAESVAYLSIHSNPGASVAIDSAAQGVTDGRGELVLSVKPGSHLLTLSLAGYQEQSQKLNLKAGEHNTTIVTLAQIPPKPIPTPAPAIQAVQIVSFAASAAQIEIGHTTTLQWKTANATEVSIDNGIGQVDLTGQTNVRPSTNTTYVLTARGPAGTQQRSVNVLVEKVAQPVPAAAPQPVAPRVDDGALIQAVLANFNAALRAHSVPRMRSVWTGMSSGQARLFEKTFKDNPQMTIFDSCPAASLTISADTANWTCTETIVANAQAQPNSHTTHVTLAKKGGVWSIVDRR
jgi:serine/threonine protein kinase